MRPPNGTYLYSIADGGKTLFKSTINVSGTGSTFTIFETTRLPNGAVASTKSTWSRKTMLPQNFEVRQGKILLRARITRAALTLDGMRVKFPAITGTSYVLPSVGLISTILVYPYVVSAHPGESFTQAEIQNNQTVLIRPESASPTATGPAGDAATALLKNEEYGTGADQEHIITWLNPTTGVMDSSTSSDGATITLVRFKPE